MRHEFLDGDVQERKLIERARKGDRDAFQSLIIGHSKSLYNYLRLHISNFCDVNDVMQEAILSVWQSISAYEYQSSFKTWMFSIAKRRLADFYRKNSKHKTVPLTDYENMTTVDDELGKCVECMDITQALSHLSKDERELVTLVFDVQLSYQEVSTVLNIPVGTVKSRMSAIKAKLKKSLRWEE